MTPLRKRVAALEGAAAAAEAMWLWHDADLEAAIAERFGPGGAPPGLVVFLLRWAGDTGMACG
ncbi:MAG: hypothetical protein IT556_03545 [Acetobacteraceae bacterium]|nr:hypothetical protein [Acetobacteraceae bacterium]